MSVIGIDFDYIEDKIDCFSKEVSNFVNDHADKINTIAMGILSLICIVIEPMGYLVGFTASLVLSTVDIALGNKLANFFSSFVPEDGTQRVTLLAALGFIAQNIFPPIFTFGFGIYCGRKFAEITTDLFYKFRPS